MASEVKRMSVFMLVLATVALWYAAEMLLLRAPMHKSPRAIGAYNCWPPHGHCKQRWTV